MLSISHRGAVLKASITGIIVAAIIATLGGLIFSKFQGGVSAASNGYVDVTPSGEVFYDNWSTSHFRVTDGGRSYKGYCAQPSLATPDGSYDSEKLGSSTRNNMIKLIIYISEYNNAYTASARAEIFDYWGADSEERYAWTHAIIGAIYADDYTGISPGNVDYINRMKNKLEGYIENDALVWAVAKKYDLYVAYGGGALQNVVWIEGPSLIHGSITAKKCDNATQSCTSQGDANFQGIEFTLYNNDGAKLWIDTKGAVYENGEQIATATTGANGEVTFSGLTGGTYRIVETSTNASYQLTAREQTVTISSDGQASVLNFYNNATTGKITVNKTDSSTGTCTTVGDASFAGTKFSVTNNSTNPIYYNGRTVAKGAVVDTKEINTSNCTVVFEGLPYGSYTVKEVSAGTGGYKTNSTVHNVTIPTNNSTNISVSYANEAILGKVTVNKIDKDTGSCTNTDELSFEGTVISITNSSAHPVYYGGRAIAKNAVIDTRTLAAGQCSVTFNDLPYGTYSVKETTASRGYSADRTTHTVNIPVSGTTNVNASTTIENQPIRGDVKFVKTDGNGKPLPNVVFSISALDKDRNVKETHIVVSNKNGVIDTSNSFINHKTRTNGYDVLYDGVDPIVFSNYGTWFGLDSQGNHITTRNDVGALPYGTYIIQELRCGANLFCSDILNQKATITINSANQVINLGDWDNTCANFSLGTTATDAKDGDKFIEASDSVTIKDEVEYCVKPNLEFTIKGTLMDKETGEPLLINGEPVEASTKIKPSEECGTTELEFTFDASELAGREVVVFERLFYDQDLITTHEDLDDADQTVSIISMHTYATNKATQQKNLPLNEYVEINDTVTYCLTPGLEYTIKGVLMNKVTSSELLIDGEPVESEVTFTPEEACGEIDMLYRLNTEGLGGAELVIFESLYYDDELILEHRDFGNADQTVVVDLPVPETGYSTKNSDGGIDTGYIMFAAGAVVIATGGYFGARLVSRKRFMR